APALSFTVTLNETVPEPLVGVPLITPVAAFRVSPTGSVPVATVQLLYGGRPPAAVNCAEYAVPTVAFGSVVVVILTRAAMVIVNDCAVAVAPALSFTVTPNVKVPAAPGVPAMAPLVAFKASPPGSAPETTCQL